MVKKLKFKEVVKRLEACRSIDFAERSAIRVTSKDYKLHSETCKLYQKDSESSQALNSFLLEAKKWLCERCAGDLLVARPTLEDEISNYSGHYNVLGLINEHKMLTKNQAIGKDHESRSFQENIDLLRELSLCSSVYSKEAYRQAGVIGETGEVDLRSIYEDLAAYLLVNYADEVVNFFSEINESVEVKKRGLFAAFKTTKNSKEVSTNKQAESGSESAALLLWSDYAESLNYCSGSTAFDIYDLLFEMLQVQKSASFIQLPAAFKKYLKRSAFKQPYLEIKQPLSAEDLETFSTVAELFAVNENDAANFIKWSGDIKAKVERMRKVYQSVTSL